jgi:predicted DNA-binding protein
MPFMPRQRRDVTNPKVQKNFMAPMDLLARLQAYAEKVGESESEVLRRALEEYLDTYAGAPAG